MSIHFLRVAVFAACCVVAPAFADPALNPTPNTVPDRGETPRVDPPVVVQVQSAVSNAADGPAVPRDMLERLAADLALENLLLTRRLAAAEQRDTPVVGSDAQLPDDPEQLAVAIAALEARLLVLRQHQGALAAASSEAGLEAEYEPGLEPGSEADAESVIAFGLERASKTASKGAASSAGHAAGGPTEIRGAAEGSVPYRYSYSFGLIGHSGRGRVVVRRQNGSLRSEGYNFNEFRDDAVWVKLLFRNDGTVAQRFTGAVALGHRTAGLGRDHVRVLATVSLSTPVLQPGEIHEIDREIRVDEVRAVDFVEVGRVRSFANQE